jgi:HAMP domain-containing protein
VEILRIATLIYVAVLVLALAASLIAIWVWLLRISRALGEVQKVLAQVAISTRPLKSYFAPFAEATGRAEEELERAGHAMSEADGSLYQLAGKLGAIDQQEAS